MADLLIRDAVADDLSAIVAMLADDPLGAKREDASLPLDPAYRAAFDAIAALPHHRLIVAEDAGRIVGTLQLTLLPGLSHRGRWHGQIEAVRVAADRRGGGLGEALGRWAIARCRKAGCHTVQLVSHESRTGAHRFWERLGFRPTHRGFKLTL